MAGKSRLLATRREAGRVGHQKLLVILCKYFVISFVLEIFSTDLTMHWIQHKYSHRSVWYCHVSENIFKGHQETFSNNIPDFCGFLVEDFNMWGLFLQNQLQFWIRDNESSTPIYSVKSLRFTTLDNYALFKPTFSYHLFLVVHMTYVTTDMNKEIFKEKDHLNKSCSKNIGVGSIFEIYYQTYVKV